MKMHSITQLPKTLRRPDFPGLSSRTLALETPKPFNNSEAAFKPLKNCPKTTPVELEFWSLVQSFLQIESVTDPSQRPSS